MRTIALAIIVVALCATLWGLVIIPPPVLLRVDSVPGPYPPLPQCESPLAVLDGKEVLVLRRDGSSATLTVMHDGAERGVLLRINLVSKTLVAPARPPAGWLIGGQ